MRQKLTQRHGDEVPFIFGRDDPKIIAAKFRHDLTADAAGVTVIRTITDHGDGRKFPLSGGNGVGEGGALRTETGTVRPIFDIASDI